MKRALLVAGLLVSVPVSAPPARAQDTEAGKTVFKTICNLCHEAVENKNRVGPSLYGVVGRHAGTLPGFAYSDVLKASGITWTEDQLNSWIISPQHLVPGTKMTYAGLKDDTKRRDLIAFLKTLHR